MTPQRIAEIERWAGSLSGSVGYVTISGAPTGNAEHSIRAQAREHVLVLCAEIRWLRAELACLEEAEAGSPAGNAATRILKGESIRGN